MKNNSIPGFFLATALTLFVGCSPKAQVKPEFEKMKVASLAVLPVIDNTELPESQVTTATLAFSQALRNAGFLVLDDSLTQRICPTSPCTREKELFTDYLVDATVQLTIESSTQTNILAGYYNDISGSLSLKSQSGEELVLARATEREKGGLIFNSGQVLQGLIQQVRNQGATSLLEKLFRNLVTQIPNSNRTVAQNLDGTALSIKSVDVKSPSSDIREICVVATPKSLASLVFGSLKANLQESTPGKYCREFFLNPSFRMASAEIEVRSPYGNSVRMPLNLRDNPACDLKSNLSLSGVSGSRSVITYSCPPSGSNEKVKLIVYRSDGEAPQFSKIGEFSGLKWTDSAPPGERAQYAVIARTSRGDRSLPIFLTPTAAASSTTPTTEAKR